MTKKFINLASFREVLGANFILFEIFAPPPRNFIHSPFSPFVFLGTSIETVLHQLCGSENTTGAQHLSTTLEPSSEHLTKLHKMCRVNKITEIQVRVETAKDTLSNITKFQTGYNRRKKTHRQGEHENIHLRREGNGAYQCRGRK